MNVLTKFDVIVIILTALHFGTPLIYYLYAKTKWILRPWNINTDYNYKPKLTIIVPTFNEAKLIEKKLDNIYGQLYPKNKLEVILVDSASKDNTISIVRKWMKEHSDFKLKIIEESVRKGKVVALNTALNATTGEIVIITDVDALWPSRHTLTEVAKWFANDIVGAVSCIKVPAASNIPNVEKGYRQFYNVLRLAESKKWSTPIFHGELSAFRKKIIKQIGGFYEEIGADDSYTSSRIIIEGYRSIIPEDIVCIELIPKKNYHSWRIRRAQHLIQNFFKLLQIRKSFPSEMKTILYTEVFLHLFNPWLLLITIIYLFIFFSEIILSKALLLTGLFLLIYQPYRTWIIAQLFLIIGCVKNLWTKDLVWKKVNKD